MFIIDLSAAALVALVLAALFTAVLSGRGRRTAGRLPTFAFLFLVLVLITWAGGAWITPFGPALWGAYLLPFLLVGAIAALLVAALLPPPRRSRPTEAPAGPVTEEDPATFAVGAFFWALLAVLTVAIVIRYI